MMSRLKTFWAAIGVALVSFSASAMAIRNGADYDDGQPTGIILAQRKGWNDSVELGRWHSNLDNARAYAEANGVPLLAIWSNGDDCGHCKKWENNAISEPFEKWMKDSGIVFYFGYYGDPGKGTTLGEWCYWCGRGNPQGTTLPLVRLYWKVNGSVIVDRSANGDMVDGNKGLVSMTSTSYRPDEPYYVPGDYHTYNMGGRYMIDFIKIKLTDKTPITGRRVADCASVLKGAIRICYVERAGDFHIPNGDFILKEDDLVSLVVPAAEAAKFLKMMGALTNRSRSVIILGGSKIGFYLAKILRAAEELRDGAAGGGEL